MSIEQRANIKFCFKHLPKLIKWWKKFMATIVDPVAAFTSGLNVFKRDGRLWKPMNVRAGQEMLWTKKRNAEIVHEFIRKEPKSSLKYMESEIGISAASIYRIFTENLGYIKVCSAHFKTSRKRPQNFGLIIILARTSEIGQGLGRILSCGARKPEQT